MAPGVMVSVQVSSILKDPIHHDGDENTRMIGQL